MTGRKGGPAWERPPFVRLALFIGLAAAAVELSTIAIKHEVLGILVFVGRDVWWTVPLVNVVLFGLGGALFAVLMRFRPSPSWWSACLGISLFAGLLAALLSFPAFHRVAALILAGGLAMRITTSRFGRSASLALLARRVTPWLLILAAVTGALTLGLRVRREATAVTQYPAPPAGSPNVLLVVLDTVRASSLSLYGYARDTTPFLNRRAKQGAVFTNAFSPAPWTLPSHASMLTGHWEPELATDWTRPFDGATPTIAENLSGLGYATGGFAANTDYVSAEAGLARGFARFDDYALTPGLILRSASLGRAIGRNRFLRRLAGQEGGLGRRNAPAISAAFLAWVDQLDRDRPWFVLLNYLDAHRPYQPPEPYRSRFSSSGTQPDPRFPMFSDPAAPWDSSDAERFKLAYDGAIAYLDAQLEALFQELERRNFLHNTIVIVTSDHGEEFGEHRLWDHGNSLYLASVHVPLVVIAPDRIPAAVIADAVSTRDLPATIADLLSELQPRVMPGRSLARLWRGEGAGDDVLVVGVRKSPGHPDWYPVSAGDMIGLVRGPLRYILNESTGAEELFDYRADPDERRNLTADPGYRDALERFRKDSRSVRHKGQSR